MRPKEEDGKGGVEGRGRERERDIDRDRERGSAGMLFVSSSR